MDLVVRVRLELGLGLGTGLDLGQWYSWLDLELGIWF